MDSQQEEGKEKEMSQPPGNLGELIVNRFNKLREDVETYPYVWASYVMVYGGFGLWTAYRWRKLRKTEDRVKALQEKLQKLVEARKSRSSNVRPVEKPPPSSQ